MSEQKKSIKCGTCGQEGHNKRTCPTTKKEVVLEVKAEVKQELQIIYALEFAEDNGDSVYRNTTLYASMDGLMKGIHQLMDELEECHGSDESEAEEDEDAYERSKVYRELLYYKDTEVFKSVPRPTKEYIESVLDNKRRSYLGGLIIKIGSTLGGASGFACEISVNTKTLNP